MAWDMSNHPQRARQRGTHERILGLRHSRRLWLGGSPDHIQGMTESVQGACSRRCSIGGFCGGAASASRLRCDGFDFLIREAALRLVERLGDVRRAFPLALELGCHTGQLAAALRGSAQVGRLIQADLALRHGAAGAR